MATSVRSSARSAASGLTSNCPGAGGFAVATPADRRVVLLAPSSPPAPAPPVEGLSQRLLMEGWQPAILLPPALRLKTAF